MTNPTHALSRRNKRKVAGFVLATLALASMLCFAAGEIVVRTLRPQRTYSYLLDMVGEQYRPGGFIPFTLKRSYSATAPSMEVPGTRVPVTTNSFGLRGKETTLSKPPGTRRILILGDSYTFGVYVADDEIYPAVLERRLGETGRNIEVLNAGHADGWSPDEHYAWLVNRGMQFEPDVVVYGFFIGNDIHEIEPDHWVETDDRGLPVRVENPNIYIDVYGKIRSKVRDMKTVGDDPIYGVPLVRESHMLLYLKKKFLRSPIPVHHGRMKGRWATRPFPFILEAASDAALLAKEAAFIRLVRGMSDRCAEGGATFLVMMIPINFQVESRFLESVMDADAYEVRRNYFEELKPRLAEYNIPYMDLFERMLARPGKYFPDNGEAHFNPNGHRFAAECLEATLRELGWVDEDFVGESSWPHPRS